MTVDYEKLAHSPRLLMEVSLKPLQGDRFQPTGFVDLGASRYTLADGREVLLVDSAQSLANRMELVCWDVSRDDLLAELKGLPYIRVNRADGSMLTNSIFEAHRINSEYIMETDFKELFSKEISYAKDDPIDWKKLHSSLLKYDLNSLIHGTFIEEIAGRLRVTRALSAFIEANNIQIAESGGVKNNMIQPELKDGRGNVPFHRTEYTAESIKAYFNLDLALLRGYRLNNEATKLLIALSLFKIRRFLSTGLRLRTACDLEVGGELVVTRPEHFVISSENDLLVECQTLIGKCVQADIFANPPVTSVVWQPKKQKDKAKPDEELDAQERVEG